MARSWRMAFFGVSAVMVTGCSVDMNDEREEDERVTSVQQHDVLTDLACPVNAQIPTVNFDRELIIRDTDVVNDGCRASSWNKAGCPTSTQNKWHFWHLMKQLAGTNGATDQKLSKFVLKWLESFEETPTVSNGLALSVRQNVRTLVINPWRQASLCAFTGTPKVDADNCVLNPAKAPFRLLAIVNRIDLRLPGGAGGGYGTGRAGEGRIVFGFITQAAAQIQGTVIFEFKLPTQDISTNPGGWTPLTWAQKWHALGTMTSPSIAYNDALQAITDQFVTAGKSPGAFNNGSAISQVRVNERDFDIDTDPSLSVDTRQWSLREFKLDCLPGTTCGINDKYLINAPVAQTPANNHVSTTLLDNYLATNKGKPGPNGTGILGEVHSVPDTYTFGGTVAFAGAESKSTPLLGKPGGGFVWDFSTVSPDPAAPDVRRFFALGTCNGCHYYETQTNFFHITNRSTTNRSLLSDFLSTNPVDLAGGPEMPYPDAAGNPVTFNEPRRRICEFLWLLGNNSTLLSSTSGRAH